MHAPVARIALLMQLLLSVTTVAAKDDTPTLTQSAAIMRPELAPVLRNFTSEHGLPLNAVTRLLQTADGYLWIGTFGGLARFDGHRFSHFSADIGVAMGNGPSVEAKGPTSNRIISLFEDDRERLWLGTEDAGISVLANGRFLQLDICRRRCRVNNIRQGDEAIWLSTNVGLWRVDMDSLQARTLQDMGESIIRATLPDAVGGMLVLTPHHLLHYTGNGLDPIPAPEDVDDLNHIQSTPDGAYIGSGVDLYHYTLADRTWRAFGLGPVEGMFPARDGTLLVALYDGRILRVHADGRHESIADIAPFIPSHITEDSEGNIWAGTQNRGVLRVHTPWIGTLSSEEFDMRAPGRSVTMSGNGGMIFALACKGLRHWHADGRVTHWIAPSGDPLRCIDTLYTAPDGTVWLGAESGALSRIAPGQILPDGITAHWAGNHPIYAIFSPTPDQLLVSVWRSTYLLQLDKDGRMLDSEPVAALEGMTVRRVVASRAGGHWFVGTEGAVRLDRGTVAERWSSSDHPSLHFSRTLHESDDGTLWIGTYGSGLNRIAGGQLQVYDQDNGLFDDTVSCIMEDRRGRLWVGGNLGVSMLLPTATGLDMTQSVRFSTNDGLIPSEINGGTQSTCISDTRGRFWYTLVEGFAVLAPDDYDKPETRPPPPHIEHVAVAGVAHDPRRPLRLPPSAGNIEIGYTAINLSDPEQLRFRFRLSGVNESWIEAGTHRSIVYPSIPWGEHTFQLQARNEGDSWPGTAVELEIVRPAPWYQRPWVWLVSTLLALILLLDASWQRSPSRPVPKPK